MIITDLIRSQVLESTVMFAAGILIALLYQFFIYTRRFITENAYACSFLEIIFWAGAAYVTSRFLYYCAYGQISVHVICAFAGGALLWKICFYDIIYKICAFLETKWNRKKKHGKKETKQSV